MADDVAIDRTALEQAQLILSGAVGDYSAYAEDIWRRDTGVDNPCGRTQLRVAMENALGAVLMRVRRDVDDGLAVAASLATIVETFAALDASLGAGWDRGYVADLP